MRRLAWLSFALVAGCYESFIGEPHVDAGPAASADAGGVVTSPDAGPPVTSDPCDPSIPGTNLGSACNLGMCPAPLLCSEEVPNVSVPSMSLDGTTGPVLTATFSPGTECTELCEFDGTEVCGECGLCSQLRAGAIDFVAAVDEGGAVLGVCRPRCVFDAATNGGCRPGYTCSEFGSCVEACMSDAQCHFALADPDGDGVGEIFFLGDDHPAFCDLTTGRCTML